MTGYHKFLESLAEFKQSGGVNLTAPLEDLVDLGFLFKEMEVVLDDWRKDCKAFKELVEKVVGLRAAISDDPNSLTIRGKLTTATVNISMVADMPKPGSLEYAALCRYLKIPDELAESGVMRPHWKHLNDLLSQRLTEGKSAPAGLKNQRSKFSLTFRKRRS